MVKNESQKDIVLFNFLKEKREFSNQWEVKKTNNRFIAEILSQASKKNTRERGEPDFIYVNENKKLLILIENKDSIKDHNSEKRDKPTIYAVDGILHYLSFFTKEHLQKQEKTIQSYFEKWKILGLAVSGNIEVEYNHLIQSFIVKKENGKIQDINNNNILNEKDYLALFENIDTEEIVTKISESSSKINRLLRNMDSQKRPIILSSLMICLFEKEKLQNDFKHNFSSWSPETIIHNIPLRIELVLKVERIANEKIEILKNQFSYAIKDDLDIANTDLLNKILIELEDNVLPLFSTNTNYDIIGKFYEEFLKYAGMTNVKNGIVLTPRHITELFTELIDVKANDIIFDLCCGTGAFLVAGMHKILELLENSSIPNKQELESKVKENQLLGFEKNPTMFSLSISNMLFRGDGKSQIYHIDCFDQEADKILKKIKPTIGFINPPYGGQDNTKNPTKKEIQFLQKLLDSCSRYGIIIAPLSTYFKEDVQRNKILEKHTLKYVINMPSEIFQPNASTHTAIAVFETHLPHNNKEVLLYDLKEDGYVLSKQKGRTDILNQWQDIKTSLLNELKNPTKFVDDLHFVKTPILKNKEWIIQAHSKTDYSKLEKKNFTLNLKEYLVFKIKFSFKLIDKKIDELSFMEILLKNGIDSKSFQNFHVDIKNTKFEEFAIKDLFEIRGSKKSFTQHQIKDGDYFYITTSNQNNGFSGTSDIFTEKGNVITFDSATEGKCFYQEKNFVGSDHVEILEPKNFTLNKYFGIYFITILNIEMFRYSFSRKRSQKRMKLNTIYLPYTVDEKKERIPDFAFMENYIKSLPYSKYL